MNVNHMYKILHDHYSNALRRLMMRLGLRKSKLQVKLDTTAKHLVRKYILIQLTFKADNQLKSVPDTYKGK